MIERVYLTGFMTSGKSTIGPILANSLGWNFFDIDLEIEKDEKMAVVEIFEHKGEEYFREVENKKLIDLSNFSNVIISLGGGTISAKNNLEIMKNSGILIYLRLSADQIYKRLRNKINRPLFRDLVLNERPKDEFLGRIEEIMNARKSYYEKADIIIDTESTSIGITVDKLVKEIIHYNKPGIRNV